MQVFQFLLKQRDSFLDPLHLAREHVVGGLYGSCRWIRECRSWRWQGTASPERRGTSRCHGVNLAAILDSRLRLPASTFVLTVCPVSRGRRDTALPRSAPPSTRCPSQSRTSRSG